ncbi:MAG TPA: TetR/AcrR family transcriptional regulator [Chthoniobacteraceae bacterium]|nr:TetR/AcrR family transcriptional regulator [Chthoniobacteraceae bacterium]
MSRTKEFDEAEVLGKALELFRDRGFKATSFSNLTSALGVSRQSLYDTYGNKETLFLAALKRYMAVAQEGVRAALADPAPVRKVLAGMFDRVICNSCDNGARGCLMANTMVELAPNVPSARGLAVEHARALEGLFASRLSAAQRKGDLKRGKDPVALARYLHHVIIGLSVASRAIDDKETLRQSARLALQALD